MTDPSPRGPGLEFPRYVHTPQGIGRRVATPETGLVEPGLVAAAPVLDSWVPADVPPPAGDPKGWRPGGTAITLSLAAVAVGVGLHLGLTAVTVSPVAVPTAVQAVSGVGDAEPVAPRSPPAPSPAADPPAVMVDESGGSPAAPAPPLELPLPTASPGAMCPDPTPGPTPDPAMAAPTGMG